MRVATLTLLLAACGGSSTADPDGSVTDTASDTCATSCFEQRWWINIASSNCNVFCMGDPGFPECAESDCQQVSAERFDGGSMRTLAPLLHSAQHRGFYFLGSVLTESYTVSSDCKMKIEARPEQSFSCDGDTLSFSVGQFTSASNDQEGALEAAATTNVMSDYTY